MQYRAAAVSKLIKQVITAIPLDNLEVNIITASADFALILYVIVVDLSSIDIMHLWEILFGHGYLSIYT